MRGGTGRVHRVPEHDRTPSGGDSSTSGARRGRSNTALRAPQARKGAGLPGAGEPLRLLAARQGLSRQAGRRGRSQRAPGGGGGKSSLAVRTLARRAAGANGLTDGRTDGPARCLHSRGRGPRASTASPSLPRPAAPRRGRWLLPRLAARGARGRPPRPGHAARGPPGAPRGPPPSVRRARGARGGALPPPPPPPSVATRCCPGSGACCQVGTPAGGGKPGAPAPRARGWGAAWGGMGGARSPGPRPRPRSPPGWAGGS